MAANLVLKEESVDMDTDIINIEKINGTLDNINIIKMNLNRVEELRLGYMRTADVQLEQNKKNEISSLTEEIGLKITHTSELLKSMKEECIKKAEQYKVSIECNAELRMENTIIGVFQARLYELIKKSSIQQLSVKDSYEEKMKRQLAVYAPDIEENHVQELMEQPEVR